MKEKGHYMNRAPNQHTNQKATVQHQKLQEKNVFFERNQAKG